MKVIEAPELEQFPAEDRRLPLNGSFRDPGGRLIVVAGRVIRFVGESATNDFTEFTQTKAARRFVEEGKIVTSRVIGNREATQLQNVAYVAAEAGPGTSTLVVEHERIPFQSFPYEWPAEMLFAAGELTMDLSEAILGDGFGLKDATPYNVLFRGPNPVFVDLLSFEKREPRDPTWLPSAQFARTFLRPLLTSRTLNIPADQMLMTHRDGVEPEDISSMFSYAQRLGPQIMNLVTIPEFLSRRRWSQNPSLYKKRTVPSQEQARFVLRRVYKSLRKKLKALEPSEYGTSTWTGYTNSADHPEGYFVRKSDLMARIISELNPRRVLDVGCNTGDYSVAAARNGAQVVSIDTDRAVVGKLWRKAARENLDILPLVVDLTRPTPAIGWLNREYASFLERSEGFFDCVFMLAVIHHMLVAERIPLQQILSLAARITTQYLVIEFVGTDDPLFKRIVRGNDRLYEHLTQEYFESVVSEFFDIRKSVQVGTSSRRMYVLSKKLQLA